MAHALVGETVPPHVRGRYGSYLQSGSAFARFFATMAGNFLAPWIGWRATFMVSALPALMVVFIRSQMPESDVWLLHKKAGQRAAVAVSRRWRRCSARRCGRRPRSPPRDHLQHGRLLVQDDLAAHVFRADPRAVA